jgi:hypothetical protein
MLVARKLDDSAVARDAKSRANRRSRLATLQRAKAALT